MDVKILKKSIFILFFVLMHFLPKLKFVFNYWLIYVLFMPHLYRNRRVVFDLLHMKMYSWHMFSTDRK